MAPVGSTTSAVRIERHGPPDVLVEREIPLPAPGPAHVRVRVHAAGVNFADLAMRMGLYGTVPPRPYSPGFEIAGEITGIGEGVSGWRRGERVVALMRHGGYAADVVVSTRQIFRYPETLMPVEAAALPVAFLTAWVALVESAHVRAGETVLVLGAGGGVGTAAVQLARWRGARVVGTAGAARKRAFVRDTLGADACFDSRGDWERDVHRLVGGRGIDVALDPVGGRATAACRRLLAPLGRLVFYGLSEAMPGRRRNWISAALAWLRTGRIHPLSLVQPNEGVFGIHLLHLGRRESLFGPALDTIFQACVTGELHPVVDRTFPLNAAGAVAAHHYLHNRANLGKVVLTRPGPDRGQSIQRTAP